MANPLAVGLLAGAVIGYVLKPDGKVEAVTQPAVTDYLRTQTPTLIEALSLNTATVRVLEEHDLVGSCIFCENPTIPTQPVYIRLNEKDAPQIDLTSKKKITGQFYRFFIDNVAGVGTLDLKISRAEIFDFSDAKVQVNITNSSIQVNITNSSLDVNILNANLDVTISNSSLNVIIQSSLINIPINLQSSMVMMPVDIQGQYVTLDMNIKSQTANINVTVANASITVVVSGTCNISIIAQNIGLSLIGDYASQNATDVNILAGAAGALTWQQSVNASYTVPAGKKYVIDSFSIYMVTDAAADYDHRMRIVVRLEDLTAGADAIMFSCEGGGVINLNKPITVPTGHQLLLLISNYSNVSVHIYVYMHGYLL
jgi:hypothetical protein